MMMNSIKKHPSLLVVIAICCCLLSFSNNTYGQCYNPSQIDSTVVCPLSFAPVCGCDGVTYAGDCEAYYYGGVTQWTVGGCNTSGGCQANFSYTTTSSTGAVVVNFTNLTSGPFTSAVWDLGDGTTSTVFSPTHTYAVSGTYLVCLTITDTTTGLACNDTYCETLVIQIPTNTSCIDTTIIDPTIPCPLAYVPVCGCNGVTYDNSCEAENYYGVAQWTSGACSTSGGCQASFVYTVSGNDVIFVSNSSGNPDFYFWQFDASTVAIPGGPIETYTFPGPGSYVVCLTVADSFQNCYDRFCDTVFIGTSGTCIDPNQIDTSQACLAIYDPVCGCDGVTYGNSCEAENYGGVTSWTQGACNGTGCIDPNQIDSSAGCFLIYDPVCGCDGVTYGNSCEAENYAGVTSWTQGVCGGTGCIDPNQIDSTQGCFAIYDPVCGCDGVTYGNSCEAENYGGVTSYLPGACGSNNCYNPSLIDTSIDCSAFFGPPVCGCDGVTYQNECVAMYENGISSWSVGLCHNVGCTPDFTYNVIVGIAGYSVFLTNTSTGTYTNSYWDFGDPTTTADTSTLHNPNYTYFASQVPQFVTICLTITDTNAAGICSATICDTINLWGSNNCIDPNVTTTGTPCPLAYIPVCGCDGVTYNNECEAYYWYGVTQWTQGPCQSSCQVSFSYNMNGLSGTFDATASGGSGGPGGITWDFGDGTTATGYNINHAFANPGLYYVCATYTEINSPTGSTCTACQTIYVSNPNSGCIDTTLIDYQAICPAIYSPVCGCDGITYSNDCEATNIGGNTSWTQGPCGTQSCQANFSYTISSTTAGYQVDFSNLSIGVVTGNTSWHWTFGDGTTSNQFDPTHTYLVPGTYTVCVTMYSSTTGCQDTYCVNILVGNSANCVDPTLIDPSVACPGVIDPVCGCDGVTYQNSCIAYYQNGVTFWTRGSCNSACLANFIYGPDSTGNGIQFLNQSLGSYTHLEWDFGNGLSSTLENPVIPAPAAGVLQNVCLTIFDSTTGCSDTYCSPVFAALALFDSVCSASYNYSIDASGLGVTLMNSSAGTLTSSQWTINGTVIDSVNAFYQFDSLGDYIVCLTVSGPVLGCMDIYCDTVSLKTTSITEHGNLYADVGVAPNPFSNQTTISYELSEADQVQVTIYNLVGQVQDVLINQPQLAGKHRLVWDTDGRPSGIYLMRITVGDQSVTKKLSVIK